jgi:hypothetical protein
MPTLGQCRCCGKDVSDEADHCPHCGQPDPHPARLEWEWQAREQVRLDNKAKAIEIVREHTGMGRAEATYLVESW